MWHSLPQSSEAQVRGHQPQTCTAVPTKLQSELIAARAPYEVFDTWVHLEGPVPGFESWYVDVGGAQELEKTEPASAWERSKNMDFNIWRTKQINSFKDLGSPWILSYNHFNTVLAMYVNKNMNVAR